MPRAVGEGFGCQRFVAPVVVVVLAWRLLLSLLDLLLLFLRLLPWCPYSVNCMDTARFVSALLLCCRRRMPSHVRSAWCGPCWSEILAFELAVLRVCDVSCGCGSFVALTFATMRRQTAQNTPTKLQLGVQTVGPHGVHVVEDCTTGARRTSSFSLKKNPIHALVESV